MSGGGRGSEFCARCDVLFEAWDKAQTRAEAVLALHRYDVHRDERHGKGRPRGDA